MEEQMKTLKRTARIAGFLYLIMAVTGPYGIMYVPAVVTVHGNAVATANNILHNELLFRSGILSNLVCQTVFIFLALSLYKLLSRIDENLAKAMVALVLVAVPISFLITFNQFLVLLILKENVMTVFPPAQQSALAMVFLRMFENGNLVIGIFWGLWLLPFGRLVYKSGFIPKIFGVLLVVGGLAYMINAVSFIILPQILHWTDTLVAVFSSIGEMSIVFWLLIKGVKRQKHLPISSNG